ncbi:MAG: hypothetical protein WD801_03705 [Gemmatimonadaceae bacterium]
MATSFQSIIDDPASQWEGALAENGVSKLDQEPGGCGDQICATGGIGGVGTVDGDFGITTLSSGACDDLARSIYAETQQWKSAKERFDYHVRELFMTIGSNHPYAQVYRATHWVGMSVASRDVIFFDLKLDILATHYNLYDCWKQNSPHWAPTSSGQTLPGPSLGGSTTKYGWVCTTRLAVDETGFPIGPVETCEYIFGA